MPGSKTGGVAAFATASVRTRRRIPQPLERISPLGEPRDHEGFAVHLPRRANETRHVRGRAARQRSPRPLDRLQRRRTPHDLGTLALERHRDGDPRRPLGEGLRRAPVGGAGLNENGQRQRGIPPREDERERDEGERENAQSPAERIFERPGRPAFRRETFEVLERRVRRGASSRTGPQMQRRDRRKRRAQSRRGSDPESVEASRHVSTSTAGSPESASTRPSSLPRSFSRHCATRAACARVAAPSTLTTAPPSSSRSAPPPAGISRSSGASTWTTATSVRRRSEESARSRPRRRRDRRAAPRARAAKQTMPCAWSSPRRLRFRRRRRAVRARSRWHGARAARGRSSGDALEPRPGSTKMTEASRAGAQGTREPTASALA